MTLDLPRRGFLIGAAALVFAPACVRAESLMKISGEPMRLYTIGYWHKSPARGIDVLTGPYSQWEHHEKTILATRSRAAISPPLPEMMNPGIYWWSNPENGGPEEHIVTDGGVIRTDGIGSLSFRSQFQPLAARG